jgi:hypothetical protein
MKQFFQKNQVVISAIASGVALVLQQYIMQPVIDYKALGLAILIAVAGVVGNQFRGKGVTVAGFLGVAATAFITIQTTGHFTWPQFGMAVIVGFLALIAPPAKPVEYEKTPTMVTAKEEVKEMKQEVKDTAIKEEIKDLKKELEPDPKPLPKTDSGVN